VSTKAEILLQRAVRGVARAVLAKGSSPEIELRNLRRVLVLRTDAGASATLLTTPLLRALREGMPHVRIDLMASPAGRPLIDGLFLVDHFVPFDRRHLRRRPHALVRLNAGLRNAEYDAVIDASRADAFSLTAALMTRFSGAPVRIGPDRSDAAHFYTHPVATASGLFDVTSRLALLSPLGLADAGAELETAAGLDAESASIAERVLSERKLAAHAFIAMHVGARAPDRRLAPEPLAHLARRLAATTGLRSLITYGPGEESLANAVAVAAGQAAVLAPTTEVTLLAALLRKAALVVSGHALPMHLGMACRTPVLALFTRGDVATWAHPVATFAAVEAADQRPDLDGAVESAALRLLAAADVRARAR